MDEDVKLKKALDARQNLHAAVWAHFDPDLTQGDKKLPKRIREALKEARHFARKHGYLFDGWKQ